MELRYDDDAAVFLETVSVNALCALFFAVTACAHWLYYQRADEYYDLVQNENMWWRWVEYAVSVPPMVIIISVLNGMTLDLPLLQGAALGSVAQFFGYSAEQRARQGDPTARARALWIHALGYVPVFLALGPIVISLQDLSDAPSFVPFLIVSQALLFTSFGAVQLWTLAGAGAERYAVADAVYLFLSLTCKATLGGSFVAATALMA